MSYTLPPITITANQTQSIGFPGDIGSISWIKIVNASPYLVQLTNLLGGQDYLQPGEANVWNVPGLTTPIQATALNFLSNAGLAPVSVIVATWYLEGERPQGSYPVNFNALYAGGTVGTPSDTLEQDMWTPFILSGVTPSHTGNVYQTTAGVAFLRQSDNSLLRIAVNGTSNTLTGISTTYYHDLNPDGSFSLGTTHSTQPNYLTIATIVTNGSGNITTVTDTRVMSSLLWNAMANVAGGQGVNLYNLHVYKDIQADDLISVQGTLRVTSGFNGDGYMLSMGGSGGDNLNIQPTSASSSDASIITFYVNPNGTPPLTAVPVLCLGYAASLGAVQIDPGGVIHANAPVQLVSGYQETGIAGTGFVATAGAQNGVEGVNFKTTLSNTPTSITLTGTAVSNATASADNLSVRGFRLVTTSSGAGLSTWYGSYTTVGNCLLAFDASAGAFDHHCDTCGSVVRAIPVAALAHATLTGCSALSYACATCGAIEAFNTSLSAADEADMTPQGTGEYQTTRGAQAALIRALQAAVGLPLATAPTAPLAATISAN